MCVQSTCPLSEFLRQVIDINVTPTTLLHFPHTPCLGIICLCKEAFVGHSCNLHGSRVALSCLEIDVIVGGKNLFKSDGLMTPCFHVRDNKNHLCCCCCRPNWQKLFANSSGSSLLVSEIHWWIFYKKLKPQTKILDCNFYFFWIFL